MGKVFGGQSELSLATATFTFAGASFAALNGTVLAPDGVMRSGLVVVAGVCAIVGIAVLVRGRRFSRTTAAILMGLSIGFVPPNVLMAANELRSLNTGMLFFPFFLYLVWFFPTWLARLLGYTWLGIYVTMTIARFGEPMYSLLLTLTVTSLGVGELIGAFRKRLERASHTDQLCEVFNKRGFEIELRRAVQGSRRTGEPISLIYIDLDDFKRINDQSGHAAGDLALQSFARAVESEIRPGDVFARFGGDEFALLLPGIGKDQAAAVGARLQRSINVVGWSYGVSERLPGESPEDFIARADQLMLASKRVRKGDRGAVGPQGTAPAEVNSAAFEQSAIDFGL